MLLRCIIRKKGSTFVGTVLELGIVEQGEDLQLVRARTEEALHCYFHALTECGEHGDEAVMLNPVPFYWLKKIGFDALCSVTEYLLSHSNKVRRTRSKEVTTWEQENYKVIMAMT